MKSNQKCPNCGAELQTNSVGGVCPKCLLQQGLARSEADHSTILTGPGVDGPALPSPKDRSPNTETPPTVLQYFGDYEILDEIARGGMGIVYKARQVSLNRIVAVKVILAGELAGEMEVRRFYTEAKAAANLQHPNIVAIHEVGECGRHYFSMDYVEGTDLAKQIRRGPLDSIPAATILKKITQAVGYAHMQGTFHRDLKPSNVLLDLHGEPRITDFGLAKRSDDREGITLSGTVLGTPAYMAPEQAAGHPDKIDGRTDVYGLGAVLYSMVTGKSPFSGETALAVMRDVMDRPPVAPSKLNPKVPVALETICLKCLEKNPENRYASAIDLAADLNRFLLGQPITAKPASAIMRVADRLRQNPWAVTGVLSFLVLSLSLGSYGLWDYARFAFWRAEHPGQTPTVSSFQEILGIGIVTPVGLMALVSFFAYMVLAPPSIYSNFANLKRQGRLTLRDLERSAGLALLNTGLALGMLGRVAHLAIWNGGTQNKAALTFSVLLLPSFWFGAHLLWLTLLQWRGRHFGEKAEEVRAVYGSAPAQAEPSKPQNLSRSSGNLCLALAALFFVTTDLLGLPSILHCNLWIALAAVATAVVNRRSLLEWKRQSRVSTQLFWFGSVLGGGFLFMILKGIFELGSKMPGPVWVDLLVAGFSASGVAVAARRLRKSPRPPRLWDASGFGKWMVHCKAGQSLFVVVALVALGISPSFDWLLCLALAAHLQSDLLESLFSTDPRRRKELRITLALGAAILLWLYSYSGLVAWGLAILGGLSLGLLPAMLLVATLPSLDRPSAKWMTAWAAGWVAGLVVTVLVGLFHFPQPLLARPSAQLQPADVASRSAARTSNWMNWNFSRVEAAAAAAERFPSFRNLFIFQSGVAVIRNLQYNITGDPLALLTESGEVLAKTYSDLDLTDDGIRYLKCVRARFPRKSPGAFKADLLTAQMFERAGRTTEAARIYSQLSLDQNLVPAANWLLAGPFPAALSNSTALPSEWNTLPGPWRSAAGLSRGGYLDLTSRFETNQAASQKSVLFARLPVISPREQTVRVKLGLPGNTTVWVNGAEVARVRPETVFNLDNSTALPLITLRGGENTLILKMANQSTFPGLVVRFSDAAGNPLTNLRFDNLGPARAEVAK